MNDFETIIYEKKDGIAYITLNRPQALNAVNIKMRDELYELLPGLDDDPEVMVSIIKGAGERGFSAGADITEFGTTPSQAIARKVRCRRSLAARLPAVNAVSRMQVELLRRFRGAAHEAERDAYKSALLLSINTVAAGLGTTG